LPKTTLYLLRHADALPFSASGDFTRTLSNLGKQQVAALATTLEASPLVVDYVYCSKAPRALQTWEGIKVHVTCDHVEISEYFYNITASAIREYVSLHPGCTVMVIAHNPGIAELAYALALATGHPIPPAIADHYPPCTLTKYILDGTRALLAEVID
jgi:phosphohistidine phosphatase